MRSPRKRLNAAVKSRGTSGFPVRFGRGTSGLPRKQRVTLGHRSGDVDHAPALPAGVVAHQLEGVPLAEPVALHEDALRALDRRAALERRLELVDLDLQPRGLLVPAERHLD